MKSVVVTLTILAVLSTTRASKLHRVSIEKLEQGREMNIHEQIQRTIQRYAPGEVKNASTEDLTHGNGLRGRSSRILQQDPPDASSRRSPKIDAERVPIQYNPSEVTLVGKVGIGTPPQYFRLAFDIGSADTWMAMENADCSEPEPCSPKRRYFTSRRSSTFESEPNVDWSIGFMDRSRAKGKLHTDLVQVGGFVIDRQVLGMATLLVGFKEIGVDGTFGLGLKDLASHGDVTPVENLIISNGMRPEVGIWIGTGKQGGELVLGGNDPARFMGDLSYFSLPTKAVYWAIPVLSIALAEEPLPESKKTTQVKPMTPTESASMGSSTTTAFKGHSMETSTSLVTSTTKAGTLPEPTILPSKVVKAQFDPGSKQPSVIFDTSSDLILLPPRVATELHRYIDDYFFGLYSAYSIFSGLYTVSCSLKTDVWIELGTLSSGANPNSGESSPGNHRFKIAAHDIVRERVPIFGSLFNICFSGIQATKSDDDDWVLGNIWFMNNYMTLDHKNRQVGIAPAVRPDTS